MPRYDILLLDADGTLFDFERAEREALFAALRARGIVPGERHLAAYREINEGLWRRFERGELQKEELLRLRFSLYFEEMGIGEEPRRFNEEYLDELKKGAFLLPGAQELCERLHGCCRLCLATNGVSRVQRGRLRRSSIAPFIHDLFVSEDLGAQKPQAAYFDRVFARLGRPPRERVIILGDSLTSDMRGGVDYGIATCWLNFGRHRAPGLPVTYQIHALEEFVPIVLDEKNS
ncbi:YjjG family noncanonical pyrimidine nucleotidase [Harryflintia acetispora]|uniref:YjjG family noncanonical pyrimidine nucleotidase n=1 Tax=Harryflintia acetispora TaxID=1849041 RepID=UPI00189B0A1B|nr:YjjG family noncanonical pyrimidine nucleotidase [Harryflintia acetispora]